MRLLLVSCLLTLFALPAFAEKADKDKPIEIEADTVTVNDAKKVSVYTGNVIVTQGSL
ncbi:MAG: LptA/OstA family protein, partial [Candidatus Methylopumilus sp.]|nr:LptA/OstA family protein [Candidatus Methylopumilus sp.]